MKLRYRILQSRYSSDAPWQNWGFFYEKVHNGAGAICHHNLDELHWVVHEINRCTRGQPLSLDRVDEAVAEHADHYRVLPEIHEYDQDSEPLSASINQIEACVLGLTCDESHDSSADEICIFSGRANRPLAHAVAHQLGFPLSAISITPLPDSEVHVQINEAVRRKDVFLIQPCTAPVNDHLVELLLMVDACRRASAGSITAIIPYFPYARQERMSKGREAISARAVASMLEQMGIDRVIYVDIHAEATQGFFTVPVDRLQAFPILSDYFRGKPFLEDAVIVSPDVGRTRLASKYAQTLGVPLVVMQKRRDGGKVKTTHVVGDVKGKVPIVIDDIIASGSVLGQLPLLLEKGARPEVHLAITHPVLLPRAMKRMNADWLAELVVSDTVLVPPAKHHPKLQVVSVAPMLAYAIRGIHYGTSISPLWEPDAPRKLGFC